jgi:pilus assembly protein CpaE
MKTVLVSPSHQHPVASRLKGLVRSRPGFVHLDVFTPENAETLCREVKPDLVIVVLAVEQPDQIFELILRLRGLDTKHVLAVGPATDPKVILRAMQVGADLFLDQDELETELDAALSRLRGRQDGRHRAGRLTAVLSTSGGCGASTLAVNLAALKAAQHGECHLIDLNSGKADLAPLLDLTPQYTLTDLCQNEARLDRAMYEKLVTRHPSGVSLLAAPRELGNAHYITRRGVGQALLLARDLYPEVIVDLEDCFHEEQSYVLQQATEILLVCRLDFTALRHVRLNLDYVAALNVPRHRVRIVVNHFGRANELPLAAAEEAIGEKLTYFIPHDPAVVCSANNSGVPAALKSPSSKVVQSIARLLQRDDKKAGAGSGIRPMLRSWFGSN